MVEARPSPPSPEKLKQDLAWFLTLFLIVMVACLPGCLCSLYYLSTVPDVTWHRGDLTYDRVWMARERGPVGIGYETQRISQRLSEDEVCITNTIRYFLWSEVEGGDQNVRYSQRLINTDQGWQASDQPCEP